MPGPFEARVADRMTSPLCTAREGERLAEARRRMVARELSALPVLDDTGRMSGVLSLTDLLRVGRMRPVGETRRYALWLPDALVREHMTRPVEVVRPQATLRDAARRMVKHHHHRLYVADDRQPVGVLTTLDLMRVVSDARTPIPVGELVLHRIVTVESQEPVSLAVDRLVASHHRSLVVLEDEWPVGVFGQREALAARSARASSPVDHWMSPAFLSARPDDPAHRVAARASVTRADCVLVTQGPRLHGVVTGMDFARLVSRHRDAHA